MKKIIPLALVLLMVVAMSVPVFASSNHYLYNETEFADINSVWINKAEYPWAMIKYNHDSQQYDLVLFKNKPYRGTSTDFWYNREGNLGIETYIYEDDSWVFGNYSEYAGSIGLTGKYANTIIWVSEDLYDSNGNIAFVHTEPVLIACDGSACPATDENHDNVCDDCGMVLAYNLRSTEYDYAVSLAEGRAEYGYPFYAIFKNGDRYTIHVSKNIMTSPDGETLEGEGMMYTTTTANSNGSFSLTGWYNGYYAYTDEFVYANHTISNFPKVPPMMESLGLVGPILEMGNQTLQTMWTLALCGVGCLALLIGLPLFGKVLRRYLG